MSSLNNIAASERTIITVPLNKLKKSPKNVRKVPHTTGELDALAASIAALGMLQYPIVEPEAGPNSKPTGHYLVNAGEGRRMAQLLRVKRKEIKKDEPVSCLLDSGQNATEISLAENAIRASMHPADEYDAFAALHKDQGMATEDIAARFGVSPAVVRQRLKLAAVSPALLTLYREGEMNLEQLMAFTITDDHARQEEVWAALGWEKGRRAILRQLTEGQIEIDDRRVVFVGLEVYEAAGGGVVRDLFDEESSYLTDVPLLDRLTREKLQLAAQPVIAEGWKWVEVAIQFDYAQTNVMSSIDAVPRDLSTDEQAKLEAAKERLEYLNNEAEQNDPSEDVLQEIAALEAEVETLTEEVYRAEDIARAGAFVGLGHNGGVRIERGYLRPEDTIPDGKGTEEESNQADTETLTAIKGLSASLVTDLTAQRTMALCNDLARAPELALVAVTHALAAKAFYPYEGLSCLGLALNQTSLEHLVPGIEASLAGKAVAARHNAWAARMPEDPQALWAFVEGLETNELMALLAHCASLALNAVQRTGDRPQTGGLAHAGILASAMKHDLTRYWQPTAAGYLGRVSKELILEAVREGAGEKAARQIADLKKAAMALRAEELLAEKGWLPPLLTPEPANI